MTDLLRDLVPLPEGRALEITERLARALDRARGRVFGNIHPDNIRVGEDVEILQTRDVRYASPEERAQRGDLDVRSDIYALGATLYHMLSGRSPLEEERALSDTKMTTPVDALISKMMAPDRAARPQTPLEVLEDIAIVRSGHLPLRRKRVPYGWIFAGAALAIVAAGIFVALTQTKLPARYIEQEGGKHRLVYNFATSAELEDWEPGAEVVDGTLIAARETSWCAVPFRGDVEFQAHVAGSGAAVTIRVGEWEGTALYGREFVVQQGGKAITEPVPMEGAGGGVIRIVKTSESIEFFWNDRLLRRLPGTGADPRSEEFRFGVRGLARYDRIVVVGEIIGTWFKKKK